MNLQAVLPSDAVVGNENTDTESARSGEVFTNSLVL
jgi:hypothetical protein